MTSRRKFLSAFAALTIVGRVKAVMANSSQPSASGWTLFPAASRQPSPAVLILHGSRGLELNLGTYERYATTLSAAGIHAFLIEYFDEADWHGLDRQTTTSQERDAYCSRRFPAWAQKIKDIASIVQQRPDCSGAIGLLGFSLGGFVAAQAAALDDRVAALAVFYGGMPDTAKSTVTHLPPTLVLHGEADRIVSIAEGEWLVKHAEELGASAKLIRYPGKGHGFDFSAGDPASQDAMQRLMAFFEHHLLKKAARIADRPPA